MFAFPQLSVLKIACQPSLFQASGTEHSLLQTCGAETITISNLACQTLPRPRCESWSACSLQLLGWVKRFTAAVGVTVGGVCDYRGELVNKFSLTAALRGHTISCPNTHCKPTPDKQFHLSSQCCTRNTITGLTGLSIQLTGNFIWMQIHLKKLMKSLTAKGRQMELLINSYPSPTESVFIHTYLLWQIMICRNIFRKKMEMIKLRLTSNLFLHDTHWFVCSSWTWT